MKAISDLIARKEYLPMLEDVQQELVGAFGKKEIEKDSLTTKFATGVLFGALSTIFIAFICAPFIQLIPKQKSTDWKVRIVARLFFAMTCTIVIKHFLDLNGFLRSK